MTPMHFYLAACWERRPVVRRGWVAIAALLFSGSEGVATDKDIFYDLEKIGMRASISATDGETEADRAWQKLREINPATGAFSVYLYQACSDETCLLPKTEKVSCVISEAKPPTAQEKKNARLQEGKP